MDQTKALISLNGDCSETLLLAITKDFSLIIGLSPKHIFDDYPERAVVQGKLENASHVIVSPGGELFCMHAGDLYRGPIQSKEDVDWFSIARRVGKFNWGIFKILFFHPNGELYGVTNNGDLYKGPQPDNEHIPWLYAQATKIGFCWDHCEVLLFDPDGILYVVTKNDTLVKAEPPTTAQKYEEWLETSTEVGGTGWLELTHFMSFCPDGKLWCVSKESGNIFRGSIADGDYRGNAEQLGCGYNEFPFLSLTKDKTVSNIISFEFLPDRGERVSESPEVIEDRIYDNRRSSSSLKHTFTFDKTVKESSSFSHEHGFTFAVGTSFTFKAGVPFFAENETTVKVDLSTTHKWNFTDTNETQVRFSSSSLVELPACKAIRVVASLVKAEIKVPYKAKVRTIYGFETEIEGTWNGASLYNLRVTQEDYDK